MLKADERRRLRVRENLKKAAAEGRACEFRSQSRKL